MDAININMATFNMNKTCEKGVWKLSIICSSWFSAYLTIKGETLLLGYFFLEFKQKHD